MASRFWIGGTGTWDASTTTNWASSSGGAGGQSVPVDGDTVTLDSSSGGGTVTLGYSPTVTSITMGAFTGTFDASTFSPTMATFSGSGTGTRVLTMGSGTWTITGNAATVFDLTTSTNLTISSNTATINASYAGSTGTRTFAGGGAAVANVKITAGTDTVNFASSWISKNLDFTGFSGIWGTAACSIFGSLTISATMSVTTTTNAVTFTATSTVTITTNGVQVNRPITFNGVGGSWTLQDSLNMYGASARALTLTNGTFNANGYNVTCGSFSSSNTNTRTLTMSTGTFTLTGTGSVWNFGTTGLTLSSSSAAVSITDVSASSKTIAHSTGGLTFAVLNITGGGSGAIIFGSTAKTFTTFNCAGPKTLTFGSGVTTTFTNLNLTGTAGNLVTLASSTPGSQYTLSVASGDVYARYVSLQDSNATGGARFFALNSTNVSNNTGWNFVASRAALGQSSRIASNQTGIANVIKTTAVNSAGYSVPYSAALNPTTAFTTESRFRLDSATVSGAILINNSTNGTTNSYYIQFGADGSVSFYVTIGGIGRNIPSTATKVVFGTWNFLTTTYTGSAIYLFLNGQKLAEEFTGISGAVGVNPGNPLIFGRSHVTSFPNNTFVGALGTQRIYNVGCTLAEHQDLYFRGQMSAALQAGMVLEVSNTGSALIDTSTQAATITLGSGITFTNDSPFRARMKQRDYPYSLSFNAAAATNQVSFPHISAYTFNDVVSCSFWAKAYSVQSDAEILGKQSGAYPFVFRYNNSIGRVAFGAYDGTFNPTTPTNRALVPSDGWVHFVGTRDGVNLKLYRNATLISVVSDTTVSTTDNTSAIVVGNRGGSAKWFDGAVSDVSIFPATLTQAEVDALFFSDIRSTTTLNALLITGSGSSAPDTSANANNGTITGASWTTDSPFKARVAASGRVAIS